MSLKDAVPPLPFDRQVVAFYSYKGGVGRTMALCNIAARLSSLHAARPQSTARILCIDLDTDAPSLSAYLPPPAGETPVRGILGLLHDCRHQCPHGGSAPAGAPPCQWLEDALTPENSKYLYKVAGTGNLFVMPVGTLSSEDRAAAMARLRQAVHDAIQPGPQGQAAAKLPCFRQLNRALRKRYTYALVDSRTGISDEAFAISVALADAMVMLFRSSITQLLGVQDLLARFLYERKLRATDPDVPVIPVLSPRPPYTSRSLREIHKLAREEIFKWLNKSTPADSPAKAYYLPPSPDLIELPFDSAVEVGERLLIPLDPKAEPEDSGAPLYKQYAVCAQALLRANAANDVLGAMAIEGQHHLDGRVAEAFKYLLARIAQEPDDIETWLNVWAGYEAHLRKDPGSVRLFWDFCQTAIAEPVGRPIPRFFANLWLSEVRADGAPEFAAERVRDAWEIARASMTPQLLYLGLIRMSRLYSTRSALGQYGTLPPWRAVAEAHAYRHLLPQPTLEAAKEALTALFHYMQAARKEADRLTELIRDYSLLGGPAEGRSAALGSMTDHAVAVADFVTACSAFASLLLLPGCADNVGMDLASLLSLVGSPSAANAAIRQHVVPQYQARCQFLVEVRLRSPLERIQAALDNMKGFTDLADDPSLNAYRLLIHGRFSEAQAYLRERLSASAKDFGVADHCMLALSGWLAGSAPLDKAVADIGFVTLAQSKGFVVNDRSALIALAANPRAVTRLAMEKLQEPRWPLHRFAWAVLACASVEGHARYRDEIAAMLRSRPLLALYTRRSENVALHRPVWEQLLARREATEDEYRRAIDIIDLIEAIPVEPISEVRPLDLPEPIVRDDDPRLVGLVAKWRALLEPITRDPIMGPVIKAILDDSSKPKPSAAVPSSG